MKQRISDSDLDDFLTRHLDFVFDGYAKDHHRNVALDLQDARNKIRGLKLQIESDSSLEGYPTQWAYDQACKVLNAGKERIAELEAELERAQTTISAMGEELASANHAITANELELFSDRLLKEKNAKIDELETEVANMWDFIQDMGGEEAFEMGKNEEEDSHD